MMVEQTPFHDNGWLIFTEDARYPSPVGVVHYGLYDDASGATKKMVADHDLIQCVVSAVPLGFPVVPPGHAQDPGLGDYADGADTLEFLLGL